MEKTGLTGNIVAHGNGVLDLYYGSPDLEGAVLTEINTEKTETLTKVQLNFRLKDGKDWSILLLPNRY